MVGPKTLDLVVRVRILPPQPVQLLLVKNAALSSRGQDTWFSAMGPGFKSP